MITGGLAISVIPRFLAVHGSNTEVAAPGCGGEGRYRTTGKQQNRTSELDRPPLLVSATENLARAGMLKELAARREAAGLRIHRTHTHRYVRLRATAT